MKQRTVHMESDTWYLDKFDRHECCDCGLEHRVKYGVEKGRIFTNWTRDDRATTRNRKRAGIKVSRDGSIK